MKIIIFAFGSFSNSPYKIIFEEFIKRITFKIELRELKLKNSNNLNSDLLKQKECEIILNNIKKDDIVIALDERGRQLDSIEFSKIINNYRINCSRDVIFILGGADGLDQMVINRANLVLSLSKMTLPHLLARIVLIEQIYRAQTIINNHPYHRV